MHARLRTLKHLHDLPIEPKLDFARPLGPFGANHKRRLSVIKSKRNRIEGCVSADSREGLFERLRVDDDAREIGVVCEGEVEDVVWVVGSEFAAGDSAALAEPAYTMLSAKDPKR